MTFSILVSGEGMSDTAKKTAPAAIASTTQTSRTRDKLCIERFEPRKRPGGNRSAADADDNEGDPYYNFVGNV